MDKKKVAFNIMWYKRNKTLSQDLRYPISILMFLTQVLPKMTSHIVTEIDHILGNKPYTKKDYRS